MSEGRIYLELFFSSFGFGKFSYRGIVRLGIVFFRRFLLKRKFVFGVYFLVSFVYI